MGDFNIKVANEPIPEIVGNFGIGLRNERGDRLVKSSLEYGFKVCNIIFQFPVRPLYTLEN